MLGGGAGGRWFIDQGVRNVKIDREGRAGGGCGRWSIQLQRRSSSSLIVRNGSSSAHNHRCLEKKTTV